MSVDLAAGFAEELEQRIDAASSHHEILESFRLALPSLPEEDSRRPFIEWETWLWHYRVDGTSDKKSPADALLPFFENGPDQFPPSVLQFPEGAIPYFRLRLERTRLATIRARLADFLWLRTRQIQYADAAVAAYSEAAEAVLSSQFGTMTSMEYVARSLSLCRRLGRDSSAPRRSLSRLVVNLPLDKLGHLCSLVEAMPGEIGADAELSQVVTQRLLSTAEQASSAGRDSRFTERMALTAVVELAGARKDLELAADSRRRIARSFEAEADERSTESALVRTVLLQDAVRLYAQLGMTDELHRAKARLHQASQESAGSLREFSTKVTISTDDLRREATALLDAGRRRAPWFHLHILAVRSLWPDWDVVAARTAELQRKFPLQSLARRVIIGPDGRPQPQPTTLEASRRFDEIRRYVEDLQISLAVQLSYVDIFREMDAWSAALILEALSSGMLFDDVCLASIEPGLAAFERGRYWDALHILVPQIERMIRRLAICLGVDTYRYITASGELHWHSLRRLLEAEPVRSALNKIHPDVTNELACLLIDSRGLNIRDDLAHGILQPGPATQGCALVSIFILLSLSVFRTTSLPPVPAGDLGDAAPPEPAGDDTPTPPDVLRPPESHDAEREVAELRQLSRESSSAARRWRFNRDELHERP